jgi:hypothetical protein
MLPGPLAAPLGGFMPELLPLDEPALPVLPILPVDPLVPVDPLLVLGGLVVEGLVVEGVVDDDEPGGSVTVSSVFLLQPPNASAAVRASATVQAVLMVGAFISFSFLKLNRLNASQP